MLFSAYLSVAMAAVALAAPQAQQTPSASSSTCSATSTVTSTTSVTTTQTATTTFTPSTTPSSCPTPSATASVNVVGFPRNSCQGVRNVQNNGQTNIQDISLSIPVPDPRQTLNGPCVNFNGLVNSLSFFLLGGLQANTKCKLFAYEMSGCSNQRGVFQQPLDGTYNGVCWDVDYPNTFNSARIECTRGRT